MSSAALSSRRRRRLPPPLTPPLGIGALGVFASIVSGCAVPEPARGGATAAGRLPMLEHISTKPPRQLPGGHVGKIARLCCARPTFLLVVLAVLCASAPLGVLSTLWNHYLAGDIYTARGGSTTQDWRDSIRQASLCLAIMAGATWAGKIVGGGIAQQLYARSGESYVLYCPLLLAGPTRVLLPAAAGGSYSRPTARCCWPVLLASFCPLLLLTDPTHTPRPPSSPRYKRRPMLVVAFVALALVALPLNLSMGRPSSSAPFSMGPYYLRSLATGVCLGPMWPVLWTVVLDITSSETRGYAAAVVTVAMAGGQGAGPMLVSVLAHNYATSGDVSSLIEAHERAMSTVFSLVVSSPWSGGLWRPGLWPWPWPWLWLWPWPWLLRCGRGRRPSTVGR